MCSGASATRPSTAPACSRPGRPDGSSTGGSAPTTAGTCPRARRRCASSWSTACRWCRRRCGCRQVMRCTACTAPRSPTSARSPWSRSPTSRPPRSWPRSWCAARARSTSATRPPSPTGAARCGRPVRPRGGRWPRTEAPRRSSPAGRRRTLRSPLAVTAGRASWPRSSTRSRTAPRSVPRSRSARVGSARPSPPGCPMPPRWRGDGPRSSTGACGSSCPTTPCSVRSRPRGRRRCSRGRRGRWCPRWSRCSRTGGSTRRRRRGGPVSPVGSAGGSDGEHRPHAPGGPRYAPWSPTPAPRCSRPCAGWWCARPRTPSNCSATGRPTGSGGRSTCTTCRPDAVRCRTRCGGTATDRRCSGRSRTPFASPRPGSIPRGRRASRAGRRCSRSPRGAVIVRRRCCGR